MDFRMIVCGVAAWVAVGVAASAQEAPTPLPAPPAAVPGPGLEDWIARLEDQGRAMTPEDLAAAEATIAEVAGLPPLQVRATYARALIALRRGERVKHRDLMREVVKSDGANGRYQAVLGSAIYATIAEATTLNKMSLAHEANTHYQKALALDGSLIEPRLGLAEFYINAPGLAGGSYRKAREQAEALLALPEGRGEYQGRLVLAKMAAVREQWKEMSEQYTLAETARGQGADTYAAIVSHASQLLLKKKDPEQALEVVERAASIADESDSNVPAIKGLALCDLRKYEDALPHLERVIAINVAARRSRFALARAYEKVGRDADALIHYEEFVKRFDKDEEAGEARAAIKRLKKKLAK